MLAFPEFPAHVKLMLLGARVRLLTIEQDQIAALVAGPLDWNQFLTVCDHHRLTPLVYNSLSALNLPDLPRYVTAHLKAQATENAFETLRAVGEIRRIQERFSAANLPVSVLKGVPLAELAFGSPNARQVGDLDLISTSERLDEQVSLLAELGYQRTNPAARLTPNRIKSYVKFWKDFTFANRASGFELDLHWRLFNNRFHPANRILDQAQWTAVSVFGVTMRAMNMEDQLLYTAAHGVLDGWTYLKSLADVAALLRVLPPAAIHEALGRAKSLGLLTQLSAAVHLVNEWMGGSVQSSLLLSPAEPLAVRIREHTAKMLVQQNFLPQRSFPSPTDWLRLELELVPGPRSYVEIARRFVWRPRVWTAVDLPDSLFWLYPLIGMALPPRLHTVEKAPGPA